MQKLMQYRSASSSHCGSDNHQYKQVDLPLSVRESECRALIGPRTWNALQQPPNRQGTPLATFNDGFDDVRCKIAEPQQPADMSIGHGPRHG